MLGISMHQTADPHAAVPTPVFAGAPPPPTATPIVGRERALNELWAVLESGHDRILTLTGAGGEALELDDAIGRAIEPIDPVQAADPTRSAPAAV
jgi:hypothetical protein